MEDSFFLLNALLSLVHLCSFACDSATSMFDFDALPSQPWSGEFLRRCCGLDLIACEPSSPYPSSPTEGNSPSQRPEGFPEHSGSDTAGSGRLSFFRHQDSESQGVMPSELVAAGLSRSLVSLLQKLIHLSRAIATQKTSDHSISVRALWRSSLVLQCEVIHTVINTARLVSLATSEFLQFDVIFILQSIFKAKDIPPEPRDREEGNMNRMADLLVLHRFLLCFHLNDLLLRGSSKFAQSKNPEDGLVLFESSGPVLEWLYQLSSLPRYQPSEPFFDPETSQLECICPTTLRSLDTDKETKPKTRSREGEGEGVAVSWDSPLDRMEEDINEFFAPVNPRKKYLVEELTMFHSSTTFSSFLIKIHNQSSTAVSSRKAKEPRYPSILLTSSLEYIDNLGHCNLFFSGSHGLASENPSVSIGSPTPLPRWFFDSPYSRMCLIFFDRIFKSIWLHTNNNSEPSSSGSDSSGPNPFLSKFLSGSHSFLNSMPEHPVLPVFQLQVLLFLTRNIKKSPRNACAALRESRVWEWLFNSRSFLRSGQSEFNSMSKISTQNILRYNDYRSARLFVDSPLDPHEPSRWMKIMVSRKELSQLSLSNLALETPQTVQTDEMNEDLDLDQSDKGFTEEESEQPNPSTPLSPPQLRPSELSRSSTSESLYENNQHYPSYSLIHDIIFELLQYSIHITYFSQSSSLQSDPLTSQGVESEVEFLLSSLTSSTTDEAVIRVCRALSNLLRAMTALKMKSTVWFNALSKALSLCKFQMKGINSTENQSPSPSISSSSSSSSPFRPFQWPARVAVLYFMDSVMRSTVSTGWIRAFATIQKPNEIVPKAPRVSLILYLISDSACRDLALSMSMRIFHNCVRQKLSQSSSSTSTPFDNVSLDILRAVIVSVKEASKFPNKEEACFTAISALRALGSLVAGKDRSLCLSALMSYGTDFKYSIYHHLMRSLEDCFQVAGNNWSAFLKTSLLRQVFRFLSLMMKHNDEAKDVFRQLIFRRRKNPPSHYYTDVAMIVLSAEAQPSFETVLIFVDMLLAGLSPLNESLWQSPSSKISSPILSSPIFSDCSELDQNNPPSASPFYIPVIENINAIPILLELIVHSSPELQQLVFELFSNLITGNASYINLSKCNKMQPSLLEMVFDAFPSLSKVGQSAAVTMLQKVGTSCITVAQLKRMFMLMKCKDDKLMRRPVFTWHLLDALQGMTNDVIEDPKSFLFFQGTETSSLKLPSLRKFSKGFSFATWFSLSYPATKFVPGDSNFLSNHRPTILSLRHDAGTGFEIYLEPVIRTDAQSVQSICGYSVVLEVFSKLGQPSTRLSLPLHTPASSGPRSRRPSYRSHSPSSSSTTSISPNDSRLRSLSHAGDEIQLETRPSWHFLCFSHSYHKIGFQKSELIFVLDRQIVKDSVIFPTLSESIRHPMIGNRSPLAAETSFAGRMASISFFSDGLSEIQIKQLFDKGPKFSTLNEREVEAETANPLSITPLIMLAYNPGVWTGRKLIDITPERNLNRWTPLDSDSGSTFSEHFPTSNELLLHAERQEGTYQFTSRNMREALDCLGGIKVLLPLFAQLDLEVDDEATRHRGVDLVRPDPQDSPSRSATQSDSKLPTTAKQELCPKILELLFSLLRNSPETSLFMEGAGFPLLAYMLERVSPSHLTMETLNLMISNVEKLDWNPQWQENLVRHILCNFKLWSGATFLVQKRLLEFLLSFTFSSKHSESIMTLQKIFDSLVLFHSNQSHRTAPSPLIVSSSSISDFQSIEVVAAEAVPGPETPVLLAQPVESEASCIPLQVDSQPLLSIEIEPTSILQTQSSSSKKSQLGESELTEIRSLFSRIVLGLISGNSHLIEDAISCLLNYITIISTFRQKIEGLQLLLEVMNPISPENIFLVFSQPGKFDLLVDILYSPNQSVKMYALLCLCSLLQLATRYGRFPSDVPTTSSNHSLSPTPISSPDHSSRSFVHLTQSPPAYSPLETRNRHNTLSLPIHSDKRTTYTQDLPPPPPTPSRAKDTFDSFGLPLSTLTKHFLWVADQLISFHSSTSLPDRPKFLAISFNALYSLMTGQSCKPLALELQTNFSHHDEDPAHLSLGNVFFQEQVEIIPTSERKIAVPMVLPALFKLLQNSHMHGHQRLTFLTMLHRDLTFRENRGSLLSIPEWQLYLFELMFSEKETLRLTSELKTKLANRVSIFCPSLRKCIDNWSPPFILWFEFQLSQFLAVSGSPSSEVDLGSFFSHLDSECDNSKSVLSLIHEIFTNVHLTSIGFSLFSPPLRISRPITDRKRTSLDSEQDASRSSPHQVGANTLRDTINQLRAFAADHHLLDFKDLGLRLIEDTLTPIAHNPSLFFPRSQSESISADIQYLSLPNKFEQNLLVISFLLLEFSTLCSPFSMKSLVSSSSLISRPRSNQRIVSFEDSDLPLPTHRVSHTFPFFNRGRSSSDHILPIAALVPESNDLSLDYEVADLPSSPPQIINPHFETQSSSDEASSSIFHHLTLGENDEFLTRFYRSVDLVCSLFQNLQSEELNTPRSVSTDRTSPSPSSSKHQRFGKHSFQPNKDKPSSEPLPSKLVHSADIIIPLSRLLALLFFKGEQLCSDICPAPIQAISTLRVLLEEGFKLSEYQPTSPSHFTNYQLVSSILLIQISTTLRHTTLPPSSIWVKEGIKTILKLAHAQRFYLTSRLKQTSSLLENSSSISQEQELLSFLSKSEKEQSSPLQGLLFERLDVMCRPNSASSLSSGEIVLESIRLGLSLPNDCCLTWNLFLSGLERVHRNSKAQEENHLVDRLKALGVRKSQPQEAVQLCLSLASIRLNMSENIRSKLSDLVQQAQISEWKRLKDFQKTDDSNRKRLQASWSSLLDELATERGPWGSGVDEALDILWTIDESAINDLQVRPKLRRNPQGDRHLISSQLTHSHFLLNGGPGDPVSINIEASSLFAAKSSTHEEMTTNSELWRDLRKFQSQPELSVEKADLSNGEKLEDLPAEGELSDDEDIEEPPIDQKGPTTSEVPLFRSSCEIITQSTNTISQKSTGTLELTKSRLTFTRTDPNSQIGSRKTQSLVGIGAVSAPSIIISLAKSKAEEAHEPVSLAHIGSAVIDSLPVCQPFQTTTWKLSDIQEVLRRSYQLRSVAIEIFFTNRTTVFINLQETAAVKAFLKRIDELKFPHLRQTRLLTPLQLMSKFEVPGSGQNITHDWVNGLISNFDYLMWLNRIAGRNYNDLGQFPVFPWIIADYTSDSLDLRDPAVFRDLEYPIGAQSEQQRDFVRSRYADLDLMYMQTVGTEFQSMPPFNFGSHYSVSGFAIWYLMRAEPYTSLHIQLQDGKFDKPDRLFESIAMAYKGCTTNVSDVKELIPEMFYCPEILLNTNRVDMGTTQTGRLIHNVGLPPWAKDAYDFIHKHREALECEYVSQNLHKWIDLIFGYKQRPPHLGGSIEAVKSCNVYFHLTYEGAVDLEEVHKSDPILYQQYVCQISEFGQTPSQLFSTPHPMRLPICKTDYIWKIASILQGVDSEYMSFSSIEDKIKRPKVVAFKEQFLTRNPLVYIAEAQGVLVTLDVSRFIGCHTWQVLSADVVPPFKFKPNPSFQGDHGGILSLARNIVKTNGPHRERHIGVPFATPISVKTYTENQTKNWKPLSKATYLEMDRYRVNKNRPRHRKDSNPQPTKSGTPVLGGLGRKDRDDLSVGSSASSKFSVGTSPIVQEMLGKLPPRYPVREPHISSNHFVLIPELRLLFSCGHWDDSIRVTQIDTGATVQTIKTHSDTVNCLSVTRDFGRYWLVSGSKDCTMMIWEIVPNGWAGTIPEFRPTHILHGHDDSINCVAVSSQYNIVVSASDDGTIIVHNLREGTYIRSFYDGSGSFDSWTLPPLTAQNNSLPTQSPVHSSNHSSPSPQSASSSFSSHQHHQRSVTWVGVSKQGFIVTYSSEDGLLVSYTLNGHIMASKQIREALYCFLLSEDGNVLLTGGDACLVVLRWVRTLEVADDGPRGGLDAILDRQDESLQSFPSPIRSLYMTKDETLLLVGLESGEMHILAQDSDYLRQRLQRRLKEIGIL